MARLYCFPGPTGARLLDQQCSVRGTGPNILEEVAQVAKKSGKTALNVLGIIGVALILTGAMAVKDGSYAFFSVGIVLLALQTFDLPSLQPKKVVLAEIVLSASLTVAAVSQLILARGFKAPQMFLIILVVGAVLIVVESARKFMDL